VWRRVFHGRRSSRILAITVASFVALVLLAGVASVALDAPVRRTMEREVNRRLTGYSVRIGRLDLQLYRLAVDLKDVTIRQDSNPEPPVAQLPRLHASVQWGALLRGHLVADFLFVRPQLYVNLEQAKTEAKSPTKLKDRGWQEAALAIFPLKINLLKIEHGRLTYIDQDQTHPLQLQAVDLEANDIRNVRSKPHAYPSAIRASAVVFDSGHASIEGHADFLSEPFPGFHVLFDLREIPLGKLQPVSHHANLSVKGGILSARGETEYAPGARRAVLSDLDIENLSVDYVAPAEPAPGTKTASSPAAEPATSGGTRAASAKPGREAPARTVTQASESARASENSAESKPAPEGVSGNDRLDLQIGRLRIAESEFGFENRAKSPPYRVFIDRANLTLTGYGNRVSKEPAVATLTGRFMGSGPARATVRLPPDQGKGPDLDVTVRIEDTDMSRLNRLLDAYGNFDVTEGKFSLYSELRVRNGVLNGYVKPLFRDMKIYDPNQDRRKGVFQKLYEQVVGVVAKLLENRQRDEVATVAELSGPIGRPNSSTLQVIGGLVQNAFFKAILPGLERNIARQSRGPRPG